MSKLKISENLFLEVAELNRFRSFMVDDGWKKVIHSMIKSYGIVENADNSYYKPSKPDGINDRVVVNPGLAFDNNLDAIVSTDADTLIIQNDGNKYWIVLSRGVRNTEEGTVSITANGTLTGYGTKFTEVLRGQPNFPTKIRLNSEIPQNQGDYEVVQVNNDSSAIIAGSFYAENNLKYSVVGTFTPGYQPLEENKLIYEFDDHTLTLVASVGTPTLLDGQYLIGSAYYDEYGVLNVSDERAPYMFDNEYDSSSSIHAVGSEVGNVPIVSLLSTKIVSGINSENSISCDLEMIFEHGYKITNQTLTITESANIFTIVSGYCNFLGSGDNIPVDYFKGWLVVNRTNMISSTISSSSGKVLFLNSVRENFMLEEGNDFYIIPKFREIEYEVICQSNVEMPEKPFYFRTTISNPYTRARIYLTFPSQGGTNYQSATIKLRYRMVDNAGNFYPYRTLSVANFNNIQGDSETLSNSSFTVNVGNVEPLVATRNYS